MANYYTNCTANNVIPCSEDDFQKLEELLAVKDMAADEEDENSHGMTASLFEGNLHMFDDCGSAEVEELGREVLGHIALILRKAGLDRWEFGMSFTSDKSRPGSNGGDAFVITDAGKMIWQNHTWPEEVSTSQHWIISGRIPGDDEDTTDYINCGPEEDPVNLFVIGLYEGRSLPQLECYTDGLGHILQDHQTEETYAYINAKIRIPGPPIG